MSTEITTPAYTATLSPHSPRAADLLEVFGTLTVPIVSPRPFYAELPGLAGPQLVYLIDLRALTPAALQRAAENIGRRFHYPPAQVAAVLPTEGLPLLAADTPVIEAS